MEKYTRENLKIIKGRDMARDMSRRQT